MTVRGLLSSLQRSRNSADWRIASNILPAQPSPLCFSCLWSHTVITSFLSDHQICSCYYFSQSVCCLKSCLLHSSWCSGVHLGMFNLLTGFQLLFFFINPVNDTKLFQDDWHQSGRVLVIGTPFANEVIFVSQQVERLWCICWEQFLAGCYEGRDRGPLQAHKAFAFGACLTPVESLDFLLFFSCQTGKNNQPPSLPNQKNSLCLPTCRNLVRFPLSVELDPCWEGLCQNEYTCSFILQVIASIISSLRCNVLFSPPPQGSI